MKTITITGYRRPQLFRDLLHSLAQNDLRGWHVYVRLEPTSMTQEYFAAASESLAGIDFTIKVNSERLGVRRNPFALLQEVFALGSDLNIYLEEDLLVSADLTRVADWFAGEEKADCLCLSLLAGGCGSAGLLSYADYPAAFFSSKTFNSLGFIVTSEQWHKYLEPCWMTDDPSGCAPDGERAFGWDWAIYLHLLGQAALHTIQPVLARARHTGREGGEHCAPEFHDLAFGDLPILASASEDLGYKILKVDELPSDVRRHALLWQQAAQSLAALRTKQKRIDSLAAEVAIGDQNRQALQQNLDRIIAEQNESLSRLVVERDAEREMRVQLEQANQDLELRRQAERRDAACAMKLQAEQASSELEGLRQELRLALARLAVNQEMHESELSGLTEALGRHEAENRRLVDHAYRLTLERDEADRRLLDAETNIATMARRIHFHRSFTGYRAWPSRWFACLIPALLSVARGAARRKYYNVAKEAYRLLLGLSPTHWPCWVQYGHMLKWGGDYSLAEGAYREAIELNSTQADSFLQLGHVLKLQGFTVDAINAYATALKLDSNLDLARQELLSFGMITEQVNSPIHPPRRDHRQMAGNEPLTCEDEAT